jgi:hypothetical protein
MASKTEVGTNIYLEAEASGAVPASPKPRAIRRVTDTLEGSYDAIASATLLPGRNPAKDDKGTDSSAGDLTVEFAPSEYDDLLEALLCGDWTQNTSLSDSNTDVYDLVPGIKQRSFYALKEYTQDPAKYQLFKGLQVNSLNMTLAVKSAVQMVFNLMGANNPGLAASSPVSMANKVAAMDTKRFITTNGFLKFDGVARTRCSDASLVVTNNMESVDALFQTEAIEKTLGMLDITGSVTEYLTDGELYNLAKEGASGELEYSVNRDGVSYSFIMNVSFDNSTINKSGRLSAVLPFKTYGENRFILRRSTPTVAATGVSLDRTSMAMGVNDTEQLEATVAPSNATDKTVTWTSSNDSVATVVDGLVTAEATGSATITVETADGGFTDTCSITVS